MRLEAVIIFILTSFPVLGQDTATRKWFTGINAGYAIGILKNVIDEDVKGSAIAPSSKSYEKDRLASIGSGIQLNGLIGYYIDTSSFVEVHIGYSKSEQMVFTTQIFQSSVDNSPYYITTRKAFSDNIYTSILYGFKYPIRTKWVSRIKVGMVVGKSYISATSDTKTYGYSPILTPGSELHYHYKYNSA